MARAVSLIALGLAVCGCGADGRNSGDAGMAVEGIPAATGGTGGAVGGRGGTGGNGGMAGGGAAGVGGSVGGMDAGRMGGMGGSTADGGTDAARDTATRDGGTTAGSDVTARNCVDLFFCDDFEGNAVGAAPTGWKTVANLDGKVVIDTVHASSGSKSLRVVSTGAPTSSQINGQFIERTLTTLPTNAFFGRMNVWMDNIPPPAHWRFIRAWGWLPSGSMTRAYYDYGGTGGGPWLAASYLAPRFDTTIWSTMFIPIGRWSCVEWQFDGINNEMRFWIDGQAIDKLTVTPATLAAHGLWKAPKWEAILLGWTGGGPKEMWIDDVAIDTNRIGCVPR